MKLPLRLPNAMVSDGATYELEIHTQFGGELRLSVPEVDQSHHIVSWINRAIELTRVPDYEASPGNASGPKRGSSRQ
jgi:hypothetical protein